MKKIVYKYRVALMKGINEYYTITHDIPLTSDLNPEELHGFVKWLTEWIEYDVNE